MDEEKVYCSMYSRNAELYHHGIKGQKWGVQNGPPYPLDSSVSTGKRLKTKEQNIKSKSEKEAVDYLIKVSNDTDLYTKIQNELRNKIGDWYFGETKNERLEKAKNEYYRIKNKYGYFSKNEQDGNKVREANKKYKNIWLEEALKCLNLPITEKTKDAIYPIVIWD